MWRILSNFSRLTNTYEFFTRVTDSFEWESQTNLSQMWKIGTYLSHMWRIRANFSQMWEIRANPSLLWRTRPIFFTFVICSFWGDAIIRKIKDGRRRPCFSTDRIVFGTCTTTHWGEHCDQDLKKIRLAVLEEMRWQACQWEISLSPSRKPNDGPELFSVLAQLGIEVNTICKFHSNPSSSFWGDAITRKIKDGRRRPCL